MAARQADVLPMSSIDVTRQKLNSAALEVAAGAVRSSKVTRAVKVEFTNSGWDDDWDDFDSFDADFDDTSATSSSATATATATATGTATSSSDSEFVKDGEGQPRTELSLSASQAQVATTQPVAPVQAPISSFARAEATSSADKSIGILSKLQRNFESGAGSIREAISMVRSAGLGIFPTAEKALAWLAKESNRSYLSGSTSGEDSMLLEESKSNITMRMACWNFIVQRLAMAGDGRMLLEVLLLDVLPLLEISEGGFQGTQSNLTVTIVQAVVSENLAYPYNVRVQVLLGGSHALQALRKAASKDDMPTDPLVLLFALTLPSPSLQSQPFSGRTLAISSWVAPDEEDNSVDGSDSSSLLPLSLRSKLHRDVTSLVVATSAKRRRLAALATSSSFTPGNSNSYPRDVGMVAGSDSGGEQSLNLLEKSLTEIMTGREDADEENVFLPQELSPIYLSLRLTAASMHTEAARVYWFASGRSRALYDNPSAHLFLEQTTHVLERVCKNRVTLSSIAPAVLLTVEVSPQYWDTWTALIDASLERY